MILLAAFQVLLYRYSGQDEIVVGGKTSANTKHLAELAAMNGARAFHIEGPDELQADWFAGVTTAGLMSGASTPGWLVEQVADRMDVLADGS